MHSMNNQQNFSEEDKKGPILGKIDCLQYTHSGKIWRPCPTAGEGDCFFHSVFGTRDCDDGLYRDRRAKSRRMSWSAFLFHHSYGGPTGALFDVLNRCFTASDSYQHRRIDNPDDYEDYANAVAGSGYWVLVEEIPILATLENVKIVLFRDAGAEPMVFEPNLELLGDLPFRNINEVREVAICLVDGHFSRLNSFEEPIATSLVDKSNSVKAEATTIAEGMCNLKATTQEEFIRKELNFQVDFPMETDQMDYNYSNPKKGYKKLGSAGIEGSLYQINLLTLVLLNGMRKIKNWRLSTEDKAAAKLDDLIFEHLPSESAILLQAKHKKNESKKITHEDLMSVNSKSEFSLPKYFFSFQEAKCNFKVQNVVICTNLKLDEKTKRILKEENVGPDSVLHFEGAENICYGFSGCSVPELEQNIKKYQAENLKNKEVTISDEHINDFLNRLKFFSNCLGDKNVENIIQQTISRVRFSENLLIKMIREDIRTKMTDWFKEENGRYLTEVEATAMFCDMTSNKYCEDLKLYDIRFKRTNLPLMLQMQQKNKDKSKEKKGKKRRQQNEKPVNDPKRISHIIPDKEYLLNVVKIYQALPTHHKDKTLFVNPEEAFEVQSQIISAFEVQHYTILVMVCPNAIEETIAKEMCDKAMKALNTHKYKHVILIAEEKNSLATQLKQMNINYYEVITDSITFADLEETTQGEFKRKKLINFQGSTMSLEELFTPSTQDDLNQIVSSELLIKLARGDKSKVGQELPHPDNYYISRNFNGKGQNLSEEELWRSTEEKVILISDSAGMGKSCVLTSLAVFIKRDNPHLWVIRFDLNNYTNFMQRTLTENRKSVSIIDLLNSQETSKIKSEFDRKLFTTPKRVVLMLDGVDEISPTYTELVINLIRSSLLQVNLTKIFVTIRPHMSKDFIEIPELRTFTSEPFVKDNQEQIPEQKFFTLEPFSQLNQVNFLIKYWSDNLNLRDDVEKNRCQIFAKTLAEKISVWIKEKNRNNFAGIPLQTRMLAEIFQEKNQTNDDGNEWERCKEFSSSDNEEPKLPPRIALTQLYEMFINKKFDIYIKKNNPSRLPATDDALKLQLMECQKYHGALALKEIIDSDKWALFTCYTNVEWPIPSKIGDGVLFRVGIVQRQGENIEFLHRTFAEFFVANCLLIELKCKPIKKDIQQFFISSILSRKRYCVIRAFLNSRMQNELHLIEHNFLPHCISEGLLTKYFELYDYEGCAGIFECLIKCINNEQREILSKAHNKTYLMYGALHSAIRYGHLNILKLLLELNDTINKGKDAHKQFLAFLVIYAVTSNLGTFQFLSRKIDESDENSLDRSTSELHEVAFMGRFGKVELWMEKAGTDRNVEDNICGSMAHRGAVSMSRLEAVKFVMEEIGADINAKDGYGETALHAFSWGGLEIVKYLVEEGAKINEKNNKGETILHKALRGGKLEIVKYLVEEAKADINVKDNDGSTVLHVAASNGKLEIIKYLVEEARADINVEDNDGLTALHAVAYWGNLEKIKYLVEEAGADINGKNNVGWTALHVAAYWGNLKIIKYLVEEAGADINVKNKAGLTAVHAATRNGKLGIIKYLVDGTGVDINVKDNDGSAALHQAARNGKLEIIKYLVQEAGADINVKNKAGWTAVHAAARNGNLEVFKYLVEEAEVDINIKNKAGLTAAHVAAGNGKLEIFRYLVEETGVDINVKDNDGSTALHKAAYNGKLEIIKYLVEEARADINVKNKTGLTAVHAAARNGKLEIFKYLVEEASMDINVEDNDGSTALHEAAYNGKLEIIKYLVEETDADINIKNKAGLTTVHAAARNGNIETFKYLEEEAGADINVKDNDGSTALHQAARNGKLDIIKYLVEEAEADINVKNKAGLTALLVAAYNGKLEIIKYLVEKSNGADINVKNKAGA